MSPTSHRPPLMLSGIQRRRSPASHRQQFENKGEHGRILIRCQDGPTVVLAPGETATVWLFRNQFYHREQTRWRRLIRWLRERARPSTRSPMDHARARE